MEKRFESTVKNDKFTEGTRIFVDKQTGVQYLFAYAGYAGGLTLLVDKDGKPLLDPNYAGDQKSE